MNDKSERAQYYKTRYKQELEKLGLILSVFALAGMIALASYVVYQFAYGQAY